MVEFEDDNSKATIDSAGFSLEGFQRMVPFRHAHRPGKGLKKMLLCSVRSRANRLNQDILLSEGSQLEAHRTSSSDRYMSQTTDKNNLSRGVISGSRTAISR